MGQADDVTILCLRRANLAFLWLFEDGRFGHLHDKSLDRLPYNPSMLLARERVPHGAMPALRSLLPKDLFCENCRETGPEAKIRLQTEFLYCSGCRAEHPAGLFSYRQRRGPLQKRICIGREGYVRICDHRGIYWDRLEGWLTGRGTGYDAWNCNHPSH